MERLDVLPRKDWVKLVDIYLAQCEIAQLEPVQAIIHTVYIPEVYSAVNLLTKRRSGDITYRSGTNSYSARHAKWCKGEVFSGMYVFPAQKARIYSGTSQPDAGADDLKSLVGRVLLCGQTARLLRNLLPDIDRSSGYETITRLNSKVPVQNYYYLSPPSSLPPWIDKQACLLAVDFSHLILTQ
jgi:hypothetical protein